MLFRKSLIGLSISLAVTAARAQDSDVSRPYFFSGPCASQGIWTQQALNLTNRIREVALQLKNDPNCQATSQAMQKMLGDMQSNIHTADMDSAGDSQKTSSKLSSLPQEIGALRTFMSDGNGGAQQGILKTMMQKAVEFSTLTAQVQANSGSTGAGAVTGNPETALLLNLGQRVQRSTQSGLKIFNNVIDTVAKNTQCLTGPQQGQFLSAAAATLASFASSGQDQIGNDLAMAVSKVGALGRELKFSKVFKSLNKIEFMNSMSCLMEITSESYCSARDGNALYQEMNKQMRQDALEKLKSAKAGKDPTSPLAGYYILTQQLPLITSWLQKVQIGVDPKLLTDASFQVKILDKVNMFFTSVKRLQGLYNEQVTFIRSLKDPTAKRIKLIELVSALDVSLTGTNDNASSEFFTSNVQPLQIPFRLLGIGTPPEMFDTNSTMTFDRWIQKESNYASVPNSSNPDILADSVGQNLDKIVDVARESAIVYYNRFFIVDKAAIYLDSLLGTNYTIKDSLISIDQYLKRLQSRITNSTGDQSYIPSIIETRAKIGRILAKYKDVQVLAEDMKKGPRKLTLDMVDRLHKVHFDFVKEVYDQFEVLLARSGWLSNRLSKFVYYDYAMMLKSGVDLSPYFKELYYATGFAAYDKMIAMANGGPAHVESDLKSALKANKDNITALELLFKDYLVGMIGEQRLISNQTEKALKECGGLMPKNFNKLTKIQQLDIKGKVAHCVKKFEITPAKVYVDQHVRSFNEGYDVMPGENKSLLVRVPRGLWTSFKGLYLDKVIGPMGSSQGKYDMPGIGKSLFNPNKEKISFDDESGASKYLTARLCVQALAFNDLSTFWNLCKNTILASDFNLPLEATQFKNMGQDYFRVSFQDKAYENVERPDLNLSKRICAFRDFFRRNQVLYLTMGMQETSDYQPDYTIEEDDTAPELPAPGSKKRPQQQGTGPSSNSHAPLSATKAGSKKK